LSKTSLSRLMRARRGEGEGGDGLVMTGWDPVRLRGLSGDFVDPRKTVSRTRELASLGAFCSLRLSVIFSVRRGREREREREREKGRDKETTCMKHGNVRAGALIKKCVPLKCMTHPGRTRMSAVTLT